MSRNANYSAPVEAKVQSATIATAITVFVGDAISNAVQNQDSGVILTGLPDWAEPFAAAALTAAITFYAGWRAKHTPRTDPDARG